MKSTMHDVNFDSDTLIYSASQKIEDYSRDALELISKMTNLHQKLNTFDGIRMTQSDDDVESYWEMGTELLSTACHILQSGPCIIFSSVLNILTLSRISHLNIEREIND